MWWEASLQRTDNPTDPYFESIYPTQIECEGPATRRMDAEMAVTSTSATFSEFHIFVLATTRQPQA